ncbi:MAG: hypothetical protein KF819_01715 [Labilithrix sp.]|nr:hypothetical protein [Labilithrix sp.]
MRWPCGIVGLGLGFVVACSGEGTSSPQGSEDAGAPPDPSWGGIQNPVLGFDDIAIKDAFAVRRGETWHLGYSHITEEPFRFRIGFSTTNDWRSFENAPPLDQTEVGGLASPDVVTLADGSYVMTYNSHTRDVGESANKLYYRTSTDLRAWSEAKRIHVEGADAPRDRLIDAALAFTDTAVFLFFKREQTANVAVSASRSLDGPWTLLGPVEPAEVENIQILAIDGVFHLLATSLLPHRPVLHRLEGDPAAPDSWRRWSRVRELEIPEQAWNTGESIAYERANSGYLIDERARDGFFYLLFAGTTELASFEGRGHVRLGLARSRDLVAWEVPPARAAP